MNSSGNLNLKTTGMMLIKTLISKLPMQFLPTAMNTLEMAQDL